MDQHPFPPGIYVSSCDVARPVVWREQFANEHPLHLEIGFGLGEFLVQQAGLPVCENFVGIEQDWSRLCKCLSKISVVRASSGNQDFGRNIRVLRLDVTVALERFFLPQSISRVTCLFPCPWPKKTHIKHRLFSRDFLCLLNSRLVDNARVSIVTDWQPYLEWMREEIPATGFTATVETTKARFNTKFERKWLAEGQEEFWELTLVKREHRERPVTEDIQLRARFAKDFNPGRLKFENVVGETSVIYKDFVFDQKQNLGLVRLVVAEKFLTQHVWVAIIKTKGQWCIAKADGHSALPTAGVALAIDAVANAVEQTISTDPVN
jgi:tRNA (guanine-N7-)-methyltransferase